MNFNRSFQLARLIQELGVIKGRTKLQKIVHLLAARGADGFSDDFVLSYYGPYSREVSLDLDFLINAELLIEKKISSVPEPVYELRIRQSSYRKHKKLFNVPNMTWAGFARKLNRRGVDFLTALSAWIYIAHSKMKATDHVAYFKEQKPSLTKYLPKARAFALNVFRKNEQKQ